MLVLPRSSLTKFSRCSPVGQKFPNPPHGGVNSPPAGTEKSHLHQHPPPRVSKTFLPPGEAPPHSITRHIPGQRSQEGDSKASLLSSVPGKSAMKTTSVWLSRLLLISCSLVLQGDRSISSGCSQGVRWKGDQVACTMSTRGSKILRKENHVLRKPEPPMHWHFRFCSFHHCSQIEETGFFRKKKWPTSACYGQFGTERGGERDSAALGRVGVSGHLTRAVITASKRISALPFLQDGGAPCWKQSAMPTTRSTGTCT